MKDERFVLQEYAPGVSIQEIIDVTEGEMVVSESVSEMVIE